MATLRQRFLTIEFGFILSYVGTVIWGTFYFQLGVRHIIRGRTEEDVVEMFGPHFKNHSFVVNGIGDWFFGSSSWIQSFGGSYALMERCIDACDVLFGSLTFISIPLFFLLFRKLYCSPEGGRQLPLSTLKGRVKMWLGYWLFCWASYVGGVTADAGNILQSLPPEAHPNARMMMWPRYILQILPGSHVFFIFFWYRKLVAQAQNYQGGEKEDKESVGSRWVRYCSLTEWGWHLVWIISIPITTIVFFTVLLIDIRTLVKPIGE